MLNSSKIIDENGEPLVVYHGSPNKMGEIYINALVNGVHEIRDYLRKLDEYKKEYRIYRQKELDYFDRWDAAKKAKKYFNEKKTISPISPQKPDFHEYTRLLSLANKRGEQWIVNLVNKYMPENVKNKEYISDEEWEEFLSKVAEEDLKSINVPHSFNLDSISNDSRYFGSGYYFAFDKSVADAYSQKNEAQAFYINSRNPATISRASVLFLNNGQDVLHTSTYTFSNSDTVSRDRLGKYLSDNGYDSVIVKSDANRLVSNNGELMVLPGKESNIKSATDNVGTFDPKNPDVNYRKKRLHRQINPIVRDGRVRNEYADLLENKEYTPEKIADWQEKAFEWILKRGGIVQTAEDFLADKAPSDGHIAELA